MAFKDMREFLAKLDEMGQLKRVKAPINVAQGTNELQTLMRLLAETNGPGLLLENLEGYNTPDVPVIFNPFGTRERTGLTIGTKDPIEAKIKHTAILADRSTWHKPKMVDRKQAPCKDVVIPRDKISIDKQIPHVWLGKEGASYICGGVVVTKDPETGVRNVGWYRLTSLWNCKHPHGGTYSRARAEEAALDLRLLEPADEPHRPAPGQGPAHGQAAGDRDRLPVRSRRAHGRGDRRALRPGRVRLRGRPARLAGRAGEVRDGGPGGAGHGGVRHRGRVPARRAPADHRLALQLRRLLRQAPGLPAVRRHGDHPPEEPDVVRDHRDDAALRPQLPGADPGGRARCSPTCSGRSPR